MVISGVNTVTYNGDGITTAWPYTFPVTDDSEIRVQLNNADGTAVIVDSDYYVDLVNSTVYYPGYAPGSDPPEAEQPPKVQEGQTITVYREIPMTQEADLGEKWPFEVIEKGLDKLTMIAQQIKSGTERKLDDSLAAMFQLAGIVTDSDKLQHITDQYNAIDENAAAAAESEVNAAASAAAAATSATNAANSDASATATAAALTNYLATKETLTAPAVDPTLTISGAAADAKVVGDVFKEIVIKSRNLVAGKIAGATMNDSGVIVSNASYDLYIAPIKNTEHYVFSTDDAYWYGIFSSIPALASVAYDNVRHNANNFTAPMNGYVAFRVKANYAYAQIEQGYAATEYHSPSWASANDKILQQEVNGVFDASDNLFDESPLITPGYFNSSGAVITGTPNSGYYASYIPVEGGEAYSWTPVNCVYCICTYDSSQTFIERVQPSVNSLTVGNSVAYVRVSFFNPDGFPTKFMFNKGATVKTYEPHGYVIPYSKIVGVPANDNKPKYLQYKSSSSYSSATEEVDVYIPTAIGYVKYCFVHDVNNSLNCDVWRIECAVACDDAFADRFELTTSGEWECAVRLQGATDFTGGRMHGDEIMSAIVFLLDGQDVDITDYTTLTSFDDLRIVQTSTLYDPDAGTSFATHTSEHLFDKKLQIKQTINYTASKTMSTSYLAMLPAAKTVTDAFYYDGDFTSVNLSGLSDFQYSKTNANMVTVYGATSGVVESMAVERNVNLTNGKLTVTDNSGGVYNKCYLPFTSADVEYVDVTVGDLWKQTSWYEFIVGQ